MTITNLEQGFVGDGELTRNTAEVIKGEISYGLAMVLQPGLPTSKTVDCRKSGASVAGTRACSYPSGHLFWYRSKFKQLVTYNVTQHYPAVEIR